MKEKILEKIAYGLCLLFVFLVMSGYYVLLTGYGKSVFSGIEFMSDVNKVLWLLFVVAINGILSLVIKKIENKKILITLGVIFVLVLLIVSSCWVFFDFWI